jgi:hypothetical protein
MRIPRPRRPDSERVLPKAARDYARWVCASRARSIRFLKAAGIIVRPGLLAKPYR